MYLCNSYAVSFVLGYRFFSHHLSFTYRCFFNLLEMLTVLSILVQDGQVGRRVGLVPWRSKRKEKEMNEREE